MKKKLIIFIPIIIIVLLFSTLFMGFSYSNSKTHKDNYEYILKDSLDDKNPRVVDIAMLGAHDAFSSNINLSSKPNINEGGIVNNGIVNALGKGLVVRMSKAQSASAKELLYAGVRYFDVRITYIDNEYYTHHGYISDKLEVYIRDILDFLKSHKGEFIIFDIQHFHKENKSNNDLSKDDYESLLRYILSIKNDDDKSLLDYVYYNSSNKSIGELTYYDVTNNKRDAGVIILAKTNDFSSVYYRDGDASYENNNYTSIRSYWHNLNSTKEMFESMEYEMEYIKDNYDNLKNVLRVNQAQKTGFITNISIVRSLLRFSILDMANDFNSKLVKDESMINEYLKYMPIVMVDNAISRKGNFNTKINEYIIKYNKNI